MSQPKSRRIELFPIAKPEPPQPPLPKPSPWGAPLALLLALSGLGATFFSMHQDTQLPTQPITCVR